MDDKFQEIINNVEAMRENIATLNLVQDRNELVIYGNEKIHLPGMIERMEKVESAIKSIESQKTLIRGILIGLGVQGAGILAILGKVFS